MRKVFLCCFARTSSSRTLQRRFSEEAAARLPNIGPVHGLSQRPHHSEGGRCFHRFRVARKHHGELIPRSLLAGQRAA